MKRLFDNFAGLDVLYYLLVVLCGVGSITYFGWQWARHLIAGERYVLLVVVAGAALGTTAAAVARLPLAMLAVAAIAALFGSIVLMGAGSMLLP